MPSILMQEAYINDKMGYGYGDKDEKVISIQLQNKFQSQHIRPI